MVIIGSIIAYIPIIGITGNIICIIGYFMMINGFGKLKQSLSLNINGIKAVKLLSVATIIGLISYATFFADWLENTLLAISLIMQIIGWYKLSASFNRLNDNQYGVAE